MNFTTPKRDSRPPTLNNLPATPESQVLSSPIANFSSPTPSYWGTPAGGLWPPATFTARSLEQLNERERFKDAQDSGKRGRPRADHISQLVLEGTSSPSGIKCRVCNRVFPREKSLQVSLNSYSHTIFTQFSWFGKCF